VRSLTGRLSAAYVVAAGFYGGYLYTHAHIDAEEIANEIARVGQDAVYFVDATQKSVDGSIAATATWTRETLAWAEARAEEAAAWAGARTDEAAAWAEARGEEMIAWAEKNGREIMRVSVDRLQRDALAVPEVPSSVRPAPAKQAPQLKTRFAEEALPPAASPAAPAPVIPEYAAEPGQAEPMAIARAVAPPSPAEPAASAEPKVVIELPPPEPAEPEQREVAALPEPQPPALRPSVVPEEKAPPAEPEKQVATVAPEPAVSPTPEERLKLAPHPDDVGLSGKELARIEERMQTNLTRDLVGGFDLFLYVSKAVQGPFAQRMYVFEKAASGDLVLRYNWRVSTGREQVEYNKAGSRLPTYTPAGYYQLDPERFYRDYRSSQWGSAMPYAMFFNWIKDGDETGLAIHGVLGRDEVSELGRRASAGCVRLGPDNARLLFDLIRKNYKGEVPRFAYDWRTETMSNEGILWRDKKGNLRVQAGYRVLVFIEDWGGEDVVAALF